MLFPGSEHNSGHKFVDNSSYKGGESALTLYRKNGDTFTSQTGKSEHQILQVTHFENAKMAITHACSQFFVSLTYHILGHKTP